MVNEEKLMQIKYLLLTTDISVAEIAEILQYNNVQNLIRFFKKNTDQTPAVFRKEHRTTKQ
jgi:AraC-like DNA-binding protein